MAKKEIKTTIKLRRDTVNNYASHGTHVPLKGEVCIVDPTATSPWAKSKNIRIKIGDGVKSFNELAYLDEENYSVKRVYYFGGDIYEDIAHERQIEPSVDTIYIDLHSGNLYYYDDATATLKASKVVIPDASAEIPGIMRLYTSLGWNENGTMTQKAITEAIDAIRLVVDEDDSEAIRLAKPAIPEKPSQENA